MGLFSVRSAGRIGKIIGPIVNPHNLHIDGFYCEAVNFPTPSVVVDMDVREIMPKGIIIDDHEDISTPDELIRLKPIMDIDYQIIGKPVFQNKKKLGKVVDFATDSISLYIYQLYVQPPLLQSMNTNQLLISRSSIVEVTDSRIVVSGTEQKTMPQSVRSMLSSPLSAPSASTMSE